MSFQKDSGLDPATGMFVEGGSAGLSNYTPLAAPAVRPTLELPARHASARSSTTRLWVTLFFTVVTCRHRDRASGMWFAMIMNRTFKGRGLVRAAILIPWAIPTAVTAKLWFFIFAYDGIANKLLGFVGINPLLWTGDTWPARFADHHRRRLEDDALHGAADPGRAPAHPRRRLRGGPDRRRQQVADLHARSPCRWSRCPSWSRCCSAPSTCCASTTCRPSSPAVAAAGTRRRRCPSSSSTRSAPGFNSASALSTIVFLLIAFVAFLFVKFGGADVVQRPPAPQEEGKRRRRRLRQPQRSRVTATHEGS